MAGLARKGLLRWKAFTAAALWLRRVIFRTTSWIGRYLRNMRQLSKQSEGFYRLTKDSFEARLRETFSGQAEALAGRLHFVNLTQLRSHYGDAWPALETAVNEAVCAIIETHLDGNDFYTRASGAYVLVFPELDSAAARHKSRRITRDIEDFLFENCSEGPGFEVDSVVSMVSGDTILSAADPGAALDQSLHLRQIARNRKDVESLTSSGPAVSVTPPGHKSGTSGEADTNGSGLQTFTAETTEYKGPRAGAVSVHLNFRSIWHTKSKQVTSFACTPVNLLAARGHLTGADVDLDNLQAFFDKVTELMAVERLNTNLSFPIRFSTLVNSKARQRLSEMAKELTDNIRERLVLEIIDVPLELKTMERNVIKSTMTELGCSRIARVPLGSTGFDAMKSIGIVSVGCDISDTRLQEKDILPLLDKHVEAANKHGLKTYIHGLKSLSLTTAAVCAGFDHIDGETVGSLTDLPDEAYPLDPRAMYKNVRTAS